ncbi:hypothetical protein [Streptomyces sp. YKOK-I1]
MNRVKSPALAGVIGASVAAVVGGATHATAVAVDASTAPYTATATSTQQSVSSTTTLAVAVPEQTSSAGLPSLICVI